MGGRFSSLALLLAGISFLALPAAAQEPPATGSTYGGVGLIDMRNARFRPDGTLEAGASIRHQRQFYFLNFQALPFVETTFRLTDRLNGTTGQGMTNDRSIDLKIGLLRESTWIPALAVGLQDLAGTGIYGGEYVVASKRFGPLDFTFGMGWGRLGTGNDTDNPLGLIDSRFDVRPRSVGQGGKPTWNSWFRGQQTAFFGGVEYSIPTIPTPFGDIEGLRAKVEVSGDQLRDERGGYPARTTNLRGISSTRVNAGLEWQPNDYVDTGIFFVNGTDALFRLSLRMDPNRPPELLRRAPPDFQPRPAEAGAFDRDKVDAALREAGFRPLGIALAGNEVRIAVETARFGTLAQVAGRVARAVQPLLPPDVEKLDLRWMRLGVPVARLIMLREAMEAAVTGNGSAEEILATSTLLPPDTEGFPDPLRGSGLSWAIEPRLQVMVGDPKSAVLWQLGAGFGARYGLPYGFGIAAGVAQSFTGNFAEGSPSNSPLPHVRSDYATYARIGRASIPVLYAERIWSPAPDWFARLTGGLLEPMFAGISGEVLWRPFDRPYALGLDVNWVAQRDYQQTFPMLGYSVATGHLSLYLDLPFYGTYVVLRGGRYLAGDWGGTVELGRRFDSGIEVGAFATFTNVPFSQFGEGSFDKGIYVRIPLHLLGPQTASRATALFRTVLRDGGQRLAIENPLWDVVRDGREEAYVRGFQGFLR